MVIGEVLLCMPRHSEGIQQIRQRPIQVDQTFQFNQLRDKERVSGWCWIWEIPCTRNILPPRGKLLFYVLNKDLWFVRSQIFGTSETNIWGRMFIFWFLRNIDVLGIYNTLCFLSNMQFSLLFTDLFYSEQDLTFSSRPIACIWPLG